MKNAYWNYNVFATGDIDKIAPFLEGQNEKKVLVAFLDEKDPENEVLLSKILSALSLDRQRDCLCLRCPLSEAGPWPSLAAIGRKYTTNTALIFGIPPKDFGLQLQIPFYQVVAINGQRYCFSEKLSALASNAAAKKALWQSLKTLI